MSEENNIYENNNDTQYTQAPEPEYNQAPETGYTSIPETTINGQPYTGEPMNYTSGKGQGKGLGIASMVCGIVSIIGCCIPYAPLVLGIAAIVLGIIQIVKNESKGMAIAGIICGAVGIIVFVATLALGLAGLAFMNELGIDGTETPEEILNQLEMYQDLGTY